MPTPAPILPVRLLLAQLDEGFDAKAWHGPNLRGAVRRVDVATAAFRPHPGRHNVWEHAVHAAYWKYTVRRRLLGEARGSFPLLGSNWFERPDPAVPERDWGRAWRADLRLLDEIHTTLRAAVDDLSPDELDSIPPGSRTTIARLVAGVAMHDVYHAGQIQLLKRLAGSARG
jgi:uncharacterized damage-inducible protein DinB